MGEYYATVRLTDNNAVVRLGQANLTVSPCEANAAGCGCPIGYVVTALGS